MYTSIPSLIGTWRRDAANTDILQIMNIIVQSFSYNGKPVRFIGSMPIATDVVAALRWVNPEITLRTKVWPEYLERVDLDRAPESIQVIEDAGIYQLIFNCTKSDGQEFEHWMFRVIQPTVQRNLEQIGGLFDKSTQQSLDRAAITQAWKRN